MLPTILRKGDFGDYLDRWFSSALEDSDVNSFFPRIDIHEDKDNYYVQADLPGMTEKDIKIEINENNVLSISGSREHKKEVEKESYYRLERQYGKFQRSFTLGNNVNGVNAKAEYKNGELKLTLPKKEEAKPRTINIDVK